MRSSRLVLAAFAIVGLTAAQAAAQAPTVTWQQTGNQVTVQWNQIPGATQYDVVVTGSFNFSGTIATNFFTVSPPPGTYVIQVRGRAGSQVGPYSEPVTISISGGASPGPCLPLSAPTIGSQISGGQVTINWGAVPGAIGYRLQIGIAPGQTQFSQDFGSGTLSYSGVPPLGTYYARVIAGNACGQMLVSQEHQFTVSASTPGPAPSPGTPTGNRAPDPPPGQIIQRATLAYARAVITQMEAAYRGDFFNSCGNHTWLLRLMQALRTIDTRWGFNYVRGWPPRLSDDIIAYNPTAGPDDTAQQIYLFDVISGHCTSSPASWMNDVTDVTWAAGQRRDPACANAYCAQWTLAPYRAAGLQP